jgi:hypothetical protein
MSFGATPEELLDLKPATAVRIVTPPGLAVAAALLAPPRARTGPVQLRLTLAWDRGGEGAAGMERWIDHVAAELIGPDAPARIASGELPSPLRDGDAVHPGDPRYAGRVFTELSGEVEAILDARRRGSRTSLDPLDPRTFELVAPGCVLRAMTYLWVCRENGDGVHAQLTGMIALVRAAPGWELWQPAAAVLA